MERRGAWGMYEFPSEIWEYFNLVDHPDYPLLEVPQSFQDDRGQILNIADGHFGDVAVIKSEKSAIRANHYHKLDWHLTYIVNGEAVYYYKDTKSATGTSWNELEIQSGNLLFTPNNLWHKFLFTKETLMIVASGLSRKKEIYDADTVSVSRDTKESF